VGAGLRVYSSLSARVRSCGLAANKNSVSGEFDWFWAHPGRGCNGFSGQVVGLGVKQVLLSTCLCCKGALRAPLHFVKILDIQAVLSGRHLPSDSNRWLGRLRLVVQQQVERTPGQKLYDDGSDAPGDFQNC
jgi:hypothetical protein